MRILVGYASAHGSTAEIAHRIAGALQHPGWTVDVVEVQKIADPGAYDAVVLGSAIHDQEWLPEATEFVHHHQDVLRARPVWYTVPPSPAVIVLVRSPSISARTGRQPWPNPSCLPPSRSDTRWS